MINETIYIPNDIRIQWNKQGDLKQLLAFLRDGIELIKIYGFFNSDVINYLDKRYELKYLLKIPENKFGTLIQSELLKELGELFASCVSAIEPKDFDLIKEAYPNAIKFVEEI